MPYIFILLVVGITSIVSIIVRKRFSIIRYLPGLPINNTHKWVTRIILCLGVPLLIGAFVFSYPEIYLLLLIGLLVIQNGFDAYMEYKHQTEEKEYMIYLVWMM